MRRRRVRAQSDGEDRYMAETQPPFILGHIEIASLFQVKRKTTQQWRAEGTFDEPHLVAQAICTGN